MPRVLSIQSHVVHGYVGNKCATLPLQLSGFEVDAINSVQFSCHTHYKHFGGQVLKSDELMVLYEQLVKNEINNYDFLLSGYVGDDTFLSKLGYIVRDLKSKNPYLIFYCDPVMGDNGKFYVPEKLLQIYKTEILPLADVLTPNQFEAEQISGMKIRSEQDVFKCIHQIQNQYDIDLVVITSVQLEQNSSKESLSGYASLKNVKKLKFTVPYYPEHFTGTGDLFCALLLAQYGNVAPSIRGDCLERVFSLVCSKMHTVLKRTLDMKNQNNEIIYPANIELRVVDSIKDLLKDEPCENCIINLL
ncbi:hypothetical protein Ciccas_000280 [Cichlidogyrus casuarinus]|uniref:Pyridoxal kinase n=1 Tax=Cichlidogyrus casuarinus TaxID=1844966 RepID=A0ABD2QND0_9PLAT